MFIYIIHHFPKILFEKICSKSYDYLMSYKQGNSKPNSQKKATNSLRPGACASIVEAARLQAFTERCCDLMSMSSSISWQRKKSRDESFVENYGQKILILKQIDLHMLIVGNIKYIQKKQDDKLIRPGNLFEAMALYDYVYIRCNCDKTSKMRASA